MELKRFAEGSKSPEDAFELALSELAPGTADLYRKWFAKFCEEFEATPGEVLEFHERNQADRKTRNALRKAVLAYQRKLVEEQGYNPNTVRGVGKSVSKFLHANEYDDFVIRDRSGVESKGKRIITKEQMRGLYEVDSKGSRRLRAIIAALKDTGLRVSDLVNLTVEDFNGARRIQTDRGEFRGWSEPLTTTKNGVNAYVHLGPESVSAIKDYLGTRSEGWIFLTERSMPKKNSDEYTQPGQQMTGDNVSTCIKTMCRRLKRQGFNVSAHSFRKAFFTNLATVMELAYVKILSGKKIGDSDKPYLLAAETGQLTDLYIKNYSAIALYDTEKVTREEVANLQAELASLRGAKEEQNGEVARLTDGLKTVLELNAEVIEGLRELQAEREAEKKAKGE